MTDDFSCSKKGSRWQAVRDGLIGAWPICLGYFPIGMALGLLARQSGLTPFDIGLMSLLVFAGSAQFIAVAMIGEDASALSIILTTFVVNFRHLLMSSSLAPQLYGVHRGFLCLFAYGVTDESYAVNTTRFRQGGWDRWRALVLHHTANTTWFVATLTGALAGSLVPQGAFGVDFALPAMFLALLVYQLQNRIHILVAIIAAMVSIFCYLILPGDGYAVIAAVVAASCGYLVQRRCYRKRRA